MPFINKQYTSLLYLMFPPRHRLFIASNEANNIFCLPLQTQRNSLEANYWPKSWFKLPEKKTQNPFIETLQPFSLGRKSSFLSPWFSNLCHIYIYISAAVASLLCVSALWRQCQRSLWMVAHNCTWQPNDSSCCCCCKGCSSCCCCSCRQSPR